MRLVLFACCVIDVIVAVSTSRASKLLDAIAMVLPACQLTIPFTTMLVAPMSAVALSCVQLGTAVGAPNSWMVPSRLARTFAPNVGRRLAVSLSPHSVIVNLPGCGSDKHLPARSVPPRSSM
eukprot:GHUV01022575.1.p1 GENE.GHUV01022575.1~~GHUV01022575.1.p1  ORF type:complete len:122 (-),score=5.72 GHUV01022575.1:158-523(-)